VIVHQLCSFTDNSRTASFLSVRLDDHYQSLRRQLNAYGFKKATTGPGKGYWCHAILHQYSTFEEMETFARKKSRKAGVRLHGTSSKRKPKVKDPCNDDVPISFHTDPLAIEDHKTAAASQPNARKRISSSKGNDKVAQRANKKTNCKVKISKTMVPTYDLVELYEEEFLGWAISSITEFELFSMDEVAAEILDKEAHQSPPNDDALSALATVASFLPNASTSFYSPGKKEFSLSNTSAIHFSPIFTDSAKCVDLSTETDYVTKPISDESESQTKTHLMVALAEKEHVLVPTPIKLTSNSYVDISQVFESGSDGGGTEEDHMSYSIGSLSSPYKSFLPLGDRSAFTPIVCRADREMYNPVFGNMD
jgi:hypothetical protein